LCLTHGTHDDFSAASACAGFDSECCSSLIFQSHGLRRPGHFRQAVAPGDGSRIVRRFVIRDGALASGATLEFLPVTGTQAGLFGNESGQFEAWVYRSKFCGIFTFASTSRAGLFLPKRCPDGDRQTGVEHNPLRRRHIFRAGKVVCAGPPAGAVIVIEVETADPLDVEVVFERDFQLEWPAALGGTYGYWDPKQSAFYFGEEQKNSPPSLAPYGERGALGI